MCQDPIVNETRRLREQSADQFGHDPDKVFEDIQKRQHEPGRKLVSFPPRKPLIKQQGA